MVEEQSFLQSLCIKLTSSQTVCHKKFPKTEECERIVQTAAVHAHHISSSVSASVVLLIINRKIRERQHDQKIVEDVADWKSWKKPTLKKDNQNGDITKNPHEEAAVKMLSREHQTPDPL